MCILETMFFLGSTKQKYNIFRTTSHRDNNSGAVDDIRYYILLYIPPHLTEMENYVAFIKVDDVATYKYVRI